MKTKVIWLIVGVVLNMWVIPLKSQTNVYHPMLSDTSVEWTVMDYSNYIYKIKICGEKKIKGQFYKIICRTVCTITNSTTCVFSFQDTIAFMREDTVNKKIYGYTIYSCSLANYFDTTANEHLLYDFDSIYIGKVLNTVYQLNPYTSTYDTIGCIDSTQLSDGSWRMYYTHYYAGSGPGPGNACGSPSLNNTGCNPGTVVMGIGNIINPFYYWECFPQFPPPCIFGHLCCYKKNNIPLWVDSNLFGMWCNVVLKTRDELIVKNLLAKIYPTIIEKYFTVEMNVNNAIMEIYNIDGVKVLTQKLTKPQTQLNVENLCNGMYIILIHNQENFMREKIIIQK